MLVGILHKLTCWLARWMRVGTRHCKPTINDQCHQFPHKKSDHFLKISIHSSFVLFENLFEIVERLHYIFTLVCLCVYMCVIECLYVSEQYSSWIDEPNFETCIYPVESGDLGMKKEMRRFWYGDCRSEITKSAPLDWCLVIYTIYITWLDHQYLTTLLAFM